MTKANDLASLLDANGDVVSSALDNVPANSTLTSLGIPNHDDITVDGSGNVGIGTSVPNNKAEILYGTVGTGNGSNNTLALRYNSTTLYGQHYMDANGIYNIHADAQGVAGGNLIMSADTSLRFHTGSTPSERMTIDSSGNLLVGTTSNTLYATSTETGSMIGDGFLAISANNPTAYFNRITSDGDIAQFRKDGSKVGSIAATTRGGATDIFIGSGDTGLYFTQALDAVAPSNQGSDRDAAIDLGRSANRFKDLYLSGGVIFDGVTKLQNNSYIVGGSSAAGIRFNNNNDTLNNLIINDDGSTWIRNGIYLGATSNPSSANHLDDYEEGTWTPTVGGRTFGSSYGHYTKIGNLVFIHFELSTISAAESNPLIGGLPFTANPPTGSSSDYSSYIYCDEVSSWTLSSGYTNIYFRAGAGVTTLQALQSSGENHAAGTHWGTGGNVRASGFYYTNS
jgi:hypothetical protein